jgi:hypothetical protein
MSAVLTPGRRRRPAGRGGAGGGGAGQAARAAGAVGAGAPGAGAGTVAEASQAALFAPESLSLRLDAPPTLDDVISHGWEGLAAGVAMACPVCGGELAPDHGGGRCERCGSTLG